jgi:glycosyltransferase involved in cell wall biosynthesis
MISTLKPAGAQAAPAVEAAAPALRVGLLGSWKSRLPSADASYSSLDAVVWSTAQALRRRGASVTVACAEATATTDGGIDVVAVPGGLDPLLRGLVPQARTRWSSRRHHPWHLLRGVEALRRAEVQAIQVTHEFANLLPARLLARGMALATLLHAVWVDDHPQLARRLLHADAVTTVSDYVREAVIAAEPRLAERTFTVRNGVDLKAFPGRSAVAALEGDEVALWRDRLDARDRPLVLAVGRVAPEKGQHVLAAAAALLAERGLRPVVAMAGQVGGAYERPGRARGAMWREIEALVPQYAERVAASGAGADVRLLGALAPAEVRRLLAAADVFVSPSLAPEPCGLPVLEALAMDLPVVATHSGATPELVGDAGILVPPGDHAAVADALGVLLSSLAAREALARRARPQASRLSWDATAAQLEGVFRRLV